MPTQSVAILVYHHVGFAPPDASPLTVTPAQFERQIGSLARAGYGGITPSQWNAFVRGEGDIPRRPVMITFDDGYADIGEHALPALRRHGFGCAVYLVTDLIGRTNEWDERANFASLPLMSVDEIRYWSAHGVEFGAHSRTHPSLTTLNADAQQAEIEGSKRDLEALLGKEPVSFAYPYGNEDDAIVAEVRVHFALGLTISEGRNDCTTDPHRLRRTIVRSTDSIVDIRLRARYGTSWLFRARRKVARQVARNT
jgi:peptidoglycan/xylan/chitin deacetylase (PgdA/CDA1 family)